MKKTIIFPTLFLAFCLLAACHRPTDTELSAQRIAYARQLADIGNFNQAKLQLDSVHLLYPKEVGMRRQAKRLNDSIVYLESVRTLHYSDSVLQTLLPQTDQLLKSFRYQKDEAYENRGKYVHRLLYTNSNIARCYLQAYVTDNRQTILKSYYYGAKAINHTAVDLAAGDIRCDISGTLHSFEAEGHYEILTMPEESALQALLFVANNKTERLKITLQGKSNYVYYLQPNEKEALEQTYRLGILMKDIRLLEENMRLAQARISKWETKH